MRKIDLELPIDDCGTMRKIANNEEYTITPTEENSTIFHTFLKSQTKELVAEK